MKFQHLPAEMIEQILHKTDLKTFEELRLGNRNIQKISSTKHFEYRKVKEIRFDSCGIFVVLFDDSLIKIGPRKDLTKEEQANTELYRQIKKVECVTYRNYKFSTATLDLILPTAFPRLRSIDRFQLICINFVPCTIGDQLNLWNVKHLFIKNTDWNITDEFLFTTPISFTIEECDEGVLPLTDASLKTIVEKEIPIFKLKDLRTRCTCEGITETIERLINCDWKFDLDFGIVSKKISELTAWRCLRSAQDSGFDVSFTSTNDKTTTKIARGDQVLQFATSSLIGRRIEEEHAEQI